MLWFMWKKLPGSYSIGGSDRVGVLVVG